MQRYRPVQPSKNRYLSCRTSQGDSVQIHSQSSQTYQETQTGRHANCQEQTYPSNTPRERTTEYILDKDRTEWKMDSKMRQSQIKRRNWEVWQFRLPNCYRPVRLVRTPDNSLHKNRGRGIPARAPSRYLGMSVPATKKDKCFELDPQSATLLYNKTLTKRYEDDGQHLCCPHLLPLATAPAVAQPQGYHLKRSHSM